jgi:hypothetical protein
MTEVKPTYNAAPSAAAKQERILQRLLCVFSLEQLDQIAEAIEEVRDRTGKGEVAIVVDRKWGAAHPRYIETRINREFFDPIKTPFE